LRALKEEVAKYREEEAKRVHELAREIPREFEVIALTEEAGENFWAVEVVEKGGEKKFVVRGKKIERFALRTNFGSVHGVNRLRDIMKKMGVTNEVIRLGGEAESTVEIAERKFTLFE